LNLYNWTKELEKIGVGEILLTSISQEGTWKGFDIPLIKSISNLIDIPLISHGGAGAVEDIKEAAFEGNSSAIALGSMVVYQKKDMGVLINFPDSIRV
jgi:cyclase